MKRCFMVAALALVAPASLASADELDAFAFDSDEVINQFDKIQDGGPRLLSDNSTATTTGDGTVSTTVSVTTTGANSTATASVTTTGANSTTTASVTTTAAEETSTNIDATVATTKPPATTAAPMPPNGTTTKMPPKPLAVIKGSIGMKVSNPAAFVKDPAVKDAIGASIAKLVNISKDFVNVTLRVVTRRLTMQPRRLESGSVEAEYTITIPAEAAPVGGTAPGSTPGAAPMSVDVAAIQKTLQETSATDLAGRVTTEMTAKGVTSFTVEVTSVSAPTLEMVEDENATTTRPRAPTDAAVRCGAGIFVASLFALAGLGLA